jgi:hypothetical protein
LKKYFLFVISIMFISPAYGQSAVQFLTLQQSPLLLGAGQIGAAIPVKDGSGYYFNPAQLGYFSRENNLSVFFQPQKIDLVPELENTTFQSYGLALGYDFKNNDYNLPLSIGIGYLHNRINYNYPDLTTSGQYNAYDSFDCFSIGAGYDYYLLFSLGFPVKSFTSVLPDYEPRSYKATGTAFDFGAMITAPVYKLLFNDLKFQINEKSSLMPKADFTLGYSLTNVGKKIYYIDPAQADPIPRTARLGYTFNFGLELSIGRAKNLNLAEYS